VRLVLIAFTREIYAFAVTLRNSIVVAHAVLKNHIPFTAKMSGISKSEKQ